MKTELQVTFRSSWIHFRNNSSSTSYVNVQRRSVNQNTTQCSQDLRRPDYMYDTTVDEAVYLFLFRKSIGTGDWLTGSLHIFIFTCSMRWFCLRPVSSCAAVTSSHVDNTIWNLYKFDSRLICVFPRIIFLNTLFELWFKRGEFKR